MFKKGILAGFALLAGVVSAQAAPLYHSFDTENGGNASLNYFGFAAFNVTQGSVDLIGNGSFDNYPGNGLYVDTAGSTGQFGSLTTKTIFGPGTYNVGISLGGPIYAGNSDGVNVSWGQGPGNSYTLSGLTTADFNFSVTLLSPEAFTIADLGQSGNANIGATLFGFQVSRVRDVPEPVTLSLFSAGLAGAAALRRRKKAAKA